MSQGAVLYVLRDEVTKKYAVSIQPLKWGTLNEAVHKRSYGNMDAAYRMCSRLEKHHPNTINVRSIYCQD